MAVILMDLPLASSLAPDEYSTAFLLVRMLNNYAF